MSGLAFGVGLPGVGAGARGVVLGVMGRGLRVGRAYKKRWVYWEGGLGAGLGKRGLKGGQASAGGANKGESSGCVDFLGSPVPGRRGLRGGLVEGRIARSTVGWVFGT